MGVGAVADYVSLREGPRRATFGAVSGLLAVRCGRLGERARRIGAAFPVTADDGLVEGLGCYHYHSVRGGSGGDAARGWELTIEDDMVGPAEAIRVFEWVATFWCGSACRRVTHRTRGSSYATWEEDVPLPGADRAP